MENESTPTTTRWADLIGRTVIQCPFQSTQPFRPPPSGRAGHTFSEHDTVVLTRVTGDPLNINKVAEVLWTRYGITRPERYNLTWRQIILRLEFVATLNERENDPREELIDVIVTRQKETGNPMGENQVRAKLADCLGGAIEAMG